MVSYNVNTQQVYQCLLGKLCFHFFLDLKCVSINISEQAILSLMLFRNSFVNFLLKLLFFCPSTPQGIAVLLLPLSAPLFQGRLQLFTLKSKVFFSVFIFLQCIFKHSWTVCLQILSWFGFIFSSENLQYFVCLHYIFVPHCKISPCQTPKRQTRKAQLNVTKILES